MQTLDFFTPIVDDPYLFGQIAASNSLSDVYAMGGKPLTAMAIAGMPDDLPTDVIREIFRGGTEKVIEAGASLVGGHTIKNPEPIYGLSVTGTVSPQHYFSNEKMQAGDTLILSKPLGTGIASSALKAGKCSAELLELSIQSMIKLNTVGADIAQQNLANACTDVTGFGLLGHLWEICKASGVSAKIQCDQIPALSDEIYSLIDAGYVPGGSKANLENVRPHLKITENVSDAMLYLLADAQTAGGLLISCKNDEVENVLNILNKGDSICASIIGTCFLPDTQPKIHLI